VLVRDEDITKYLRGKEAASLRDAYIAYLITKDIQRLSRESKDDVKRLLNELESEKELAYFEKRQVGPNPIFKGGRLKEFLPKYAGIEYFFTGMFVENLLWSKKAVKKAKETKTSDFEVEFY